MVIELSAKQRILDTAARLYHAQGYRLTSLDQILAEAGVAKATREQPYGSKDEIDLACLQKGRQEWFQELRRLLASQPKPTDQLLSLFDHMAHSVPKPGFREGRFIKLLTEIDDVKPLIHAEILGHKVELRTLCRQLVAAGLGPAAKVSRTQAAGDVAYLLLEGALVESLLYQDTWPFQAAKRTVHTLLESAVDFISAE